MKEVVPICRSCWNGERKLDNLARWNRKYINGLSDEAFAVIEPAYSRGDTKNKNCRHLPHQKAGVARGLDSKDRVDDAHLRNSLRLMSEITPVTDSITTEKLRMLAAEHLNKHRKDLGIGDKEKGGDTKSQIADHSLFNNHKHLQGLGGESTPPVKEEALQLPEGFELTANDSLSVGLICEIGEVDSTNLAAVSASLQDDAANGVDQLRPSKEDYVRIPVRALSKVMVNQYIDFTQDNVLKDSTPLLNGVIVFPDHSRSVEAWLGSVTETSWNESSNPPGVDAILQIDAWANPKITRGLLNEPPALKRVSVNVHLEWEKSHPDMDRYEFFSMLGKKVNGSIVRIIATLIKYYGEISFVYFGSDKYAKIKK